MNNENGSAQTQVSSNNRKEKTKMKRKVVEQLTEVV